MLLFNKGHVMCQADDANGFSCLCSAPAPPPPAASPPSSPPVPPDCTCGSGIFNHGCGNFYGKHSYCCEKYPEANPTIDGLTCCEVDPKVPLPPPPPSLPPVPPGPASPPSAPPMPSGWYCDKRLPTPVNGCNDDFDCMDCDAEGSPWKTGCFNPGHSMPGGCFEY